VCGGAQASAEGRDAVQAALGRAIKIARSYPADAFDAALGRELAKAAVQRSAADAQQAEVSMRRQMAAVGKTQTQLAASGLPPDVTQWSIAHVRQWARQLGLAQTRRAQELFTARQLDGHALTWMAPASLVDLLAADESATQRKACQHAILALRAEHEVIARERRAARGGVKLERLLARAQRFGLLGEGESAEMRDAARREGEHAREQMAHALAKQLHSRRFMVMPSPAAPRGS
jgi:hypothetical protein